MLASRSLPLLLRLCLLFHLFLTWCQRMDPGTIQRSFYEETLAHGANLLLACKKEGGGPCFRDLSPGAGTDSHTARIHSQFSKLFLEMVLITTGGNQKSFPPVSTYYPVYPAPQPHKKSLCVLHCLVLIAATRRRRSNLSCAALAYGWGGRRK